MRKIYSLIFIAFISLTASAQSKQTNSIDVSIGIGLSAPIEDVDIIGRGFYLQGEYVHRLANWFDVRPYAGMVITNPENNETEENELLYKVTAKAFLFGGKARITAPIPWVAPYLEIGLGGSIGSFETFTPYTNIKKNGFLYHIPFSLGVQLGPKHNVDLAFSYYVHPSVEQVSGAAAIGVSIPLKQ